MTTIRRLSHDNLDDGSVSTTSPLEDYPGSDGWSESSPIVVVDDTESDEEPPTPKISLLRRELMKNTTSRPIHIITHRFSTTTNAFNRVFNR